ncbi:mycothiol system anti-sigma-R factor [Tamaricihabitans halophyticus]|uniref:Mycothiol system anti-sigma-R factor n=1 Tax=Tamaricihabitans halophyticus TaxID=1262583 RepID=A0A4R2QIM5_9PSEU|nr:mycothiol system anti-sigma-R factor [Tamaricihabitans halophyticus]TCP49210.1 mycothiol system anti-sigma-R factor [Tamaricihabitans halophyticus]
MSCGKPHETPCSEVLAEVWLLLDDECNQPRRSTLQHHLDECEPCLEQYGIHEHLKLLLARKCGGEHAPDEFKDRLRATIRQTVIEYRASTAQDGPTAQHG